ncbi:HAD family hydrolase [Daejeonia sp. YH14]|uniref:HAD family hydrolase n=1 Tax=Daejeonia sp. YH14 TaxID=3439042 RepID=UPI003F49AF2C
MKNIKLIVTDMDGTFLNSYYQMSPEFPQIYQELKKRKILFVPASGRQMAGITRYFPDIQEEIGFIAENGGYVINKNKEILVDRMPEHFAKDILDEVHKIPGARAVISAKEQAYYDTDDQEFIRFLSQYYLKNKRIQDFGEVSKDSIFKIAVFHPEGSEQHLYPYLKKFEEQELQVVVSGPYWLDIMNKDINKGKALAKLQHHLGISPEETMAFGDYMNDTEMLKDAAYSYAMKNAHPEVKKAARFLAPDNNSFGVVEIIKNNLLQDIKSKS